MKMSFTTIIIILFLFLVWGFLCYLLSLLLFSSESLPVVTNESFQAIEPNLSCNDFLIDLQWGKNISKHITSDPYSEIAPFFFEVFVLSKLKQVLLTFAIDDQFMKKLLIHKREYTQKELLQQLLKLDSKNNTIIQVMVYLINNALLQSSRDLLHNQFTYFMKYKPNDLNHEEFIHRLKIMFHDRDITDENYYFTALKHCIPDEEEEKEEKEKEEKEKEKEEENEEEEQQQKKKITNMKTIIDEKTIVNFLKEFMKKSEKTESYQKPNNEKIMQERKIRKMTKLLNHSTNSKLYSEIMEYIHNKKNTTSVTLQTDSIHQNHKYGIHLYKKILRKLIHSSNSNKLVMRLFLYRPERSMLLVIDFKFAINIYQHQLKLRIVNVISKGYVPQQNLTLMNNENPNPNVFPPFSEYHSYQEVFSNSHHLNNQKVTNLTKQNKETIVDHNNKIKQMFEKSKKQFINNKLSLYLLSFSKINNETDTKTITKAPQKLLLNTLYDNYDHDHNFNNKIEYDYLDTSYQCYGRNNEVDLSEQKRKYQCESSFDFNGKQKTRNVYDRPCKSDKECPFFQRNLNYENNRGGCNKGICEFPIGTKRISPRKFDYQTSNLYCHNCKDSSQFNCCHDQLHKTHPTYQLLESPDYAFTDDFYERNNQSLILVQRGLQP